MTAIDLNKGLEFKELNTKGLRSVKYLFDILLYFEFFVGGEGGSSGLFRWDYNWHDGIYTNLGLY